MRNSKLLVFAGIAVFVIVALGLALGCGQSKKPTSAKTTGTSQSGETAEKSGEAENTAYYVCPMHPEIKSTDPSVKCSICGMALVLSSEVETQEQIYACPMHPNEHSTDPNAKCSICGMDLKPVSEDK